MKRPNTRLQMLEVVSDRLEDGCAFEGMTPEQLLERAFSRPAVPQRKTSSATNDDYLTVKEVAGIVKLHAKVIRRAYESGELPAYKPRGRVRIKRADLDAWIEANRVEPYPVPEIEP